MATALAARLRAALPVSPPRCGAAAHVAPTALLGVVLALGGLGLSVMGRTPSAPARPTPALIESEAAHLPASGQLPIIGDPIADLTTQGGMLSAFFQSNQVESGDWFRVVFVQE